MKTYICEMYKIPVEEEKTRDTLVGQTLKFMGRQYYADWNYSAPHGAGRKMKREEVKTRFTVSQFKMEMKGIYSSCIGKGTLDEAPFAYRSLKETEQRIEDTVEIKKRVKPVYNYKAENER